MGKIIFWFFAILTILTVWRMINARTPRKPGTTRQPPTAKAVEPMVSCAHCGLHLPRSEAVQAHGQSWCSQEHARLGQSK
ncbi:PP0621 family protein [Bordetella avium]|uniref:PP0621 family protein n=1 Tax=Bordetella avium TaxID=521 RepID=UPI0011C41466|nr:PP0621 family protein [Bordetella avium]